MFVSFQKTSSGGRQNRMSKLLNKMLELCLQKVGKLFHKPNKLSTFAFVRVTQTSKTMQTTANCTVANPLPENEVILLTFLISMRYILFAELHNMIFQIQFFIYLRKH